MAGLWQEIPFFAGESSNSFFTEIMSGGVYGNGSAAKTCTYTVVITSAGLLANNQITNNFNYASTITSSGALAAGQSTLLASHNVAITPAGLLANGLANISDIYNIVDTGGVFAGGQSTPLVSHNVSVVAAGLLANGLANTKVNYNLLLLAGGVFTGGSATVLHEEDPPITPFGVLINGSATVLHDKFGSVTLQYVLKRWLEPQVSCLVYPCRLPEHPVLPAIVYTMTGIDPNYSTGGICQAYRNSSVSFDICARTMKEIDNLTKQLDRILNGYRGVMGLLNIVTITIDDVGKAATFQENGQNRYIILPIDTTIIHNQNTDVNDYKFVDDESFRLHLQGLVSGN